MKRRRLMLLGLTAALLLAGAIVATMWTAGPASAGVGATASFMVDYDTGAPTLTVSFDASGSVPSLEGTSIVSYYWDFDDGTTDTTTGPYTSHDFTVRGDHHVVLTVTDDVDLQGISDPTTIHVNELPVAVAGVDATSGDVPLTVNFSSTGSYDPEGTISDWWWSFGDGDESYQGDTTHEYTVPGVYEATLTIYDSYWETDSDTVTITVDPIVANDNFDHAEAIETLTGTLDGTTTGSTGQPDEPDTFSDAWPLDTVWYVYTPPADGGMVVQTTVAGFDTRLCVFTGADVANLTPVASAGTEDGNLAYVEFPVESDTPYYIQVEGGGEAEGDFTLAWDVYLGPPDNDDFTDAIALSGTSPVTGHTYGATEETGEPGAGGDLNSVWYTWTAPADGILKVSTTGWIQMMIGIYSGDSVGSLGDPLALDYDDARILVQQGQTYRIQIDGGGTDEGAFTLAWQLMSAPANDAFASATEISGATGDIDGYNLMATGETDEPGGRGDSAEAINTVWYRWVAPDDGEATFTISAADFDTYMYSFEGSAPPFSGLSVVQYDDDSAGELRSEVVFAVTRGAAYWLQVDGYSNYEGEFTLSWVFEAAPSTGPGNDNFGSAALISGATGSTTGTTTGATGQAGEQNGFTPLNTVWYRWTAPSDGRAIFDMPAGDFDTYLNVYEGGPTITSLEPIEGDDNSSPSGGNRSRVRFNVSEGATYYLQVDGASDAVGDFTLSWSMLAPLPNDDLADATVLSTEGGSIAGDNILSTYEENEPTFGAGNSVWYSFSSSEAGLLDLEMTDPQPTDLHTMLYVFTYDTATGFHYVTSDTDSGEENLSALQFPAEAGITYYIRICGTSSDDQGSFTLGWTFTPGVAEAPNITSAASATFLVGDSGNSFTFEATGAPIPAWSTTYNFSSLGLEFTDNLDGSATLAGSMLQGNGGVYTFDATAGNSYGDDVQSFTLTANEAPYISSQTSTPLVVLAGSTAYLSVSGRGYPDPTVQWQENTGSGWTDIDGATDETYVIDTVDVTMDGNLYRCLLHNAYGDKTGEPIELSVGVPAHITGQPSAQEAIAGETATFTVVAEANPDAEYQWQVSVRGARKWVDITGATSATYTTDPVSVGMSGYQYRVVVSNTYNLETSDPAALTVQNSSTDVLVEQTGVYDPGSKTITWTWTVTNNGRQWALGLQLKTTLANGTKFSGIDLTAFAAGTTSYKVGGRTVTVKIPDLAPGETSEVVVVTSLVTRATGSVSNTVVLTSTSVDAVQDNNTAIDVVSVP